MRLVAQSDRVTRPQSSPAVIALQRQGAGATDFDGHFVVHAQARQQAQPAEPHTWLSCLAHTPHHTTVRSLVDTPYRSASRLAVESAQLPAFPVSHATRPSVARLLAGVRRSEPPSCGPLCVLRCAASRSCWCSCCCRCRRSTAACWPGQWESPSFNGFSWDPTLFESRDGCQLLVFNRSNVPDYTMSLVGIDVASGDMAWNWLLASDAFVLQYFPTIIRGAAADHLYLLSFTAASCGQRVNLTRFSYDRSRGLQVTWILELGCGLGSLTYAGSLVFPGGQQSQTGAALPERVLIAADQWLTVDGDSGKLLHLDDRPPAGTVAVIDDGSAQQFRVKFGYNENTTAIDSYQLTDDGRWTALASASYNSAEYRAVDGQIAGLVFANYGSVLVQQSWTVPSALLGLDTLTGQTVWRSSDCPLLTEAWLKPYPGFTVEVTTLDLHPLRPDWLLIMNSASNASGFVISQYGLLDSATGKLLATSAVTPPVYYESHPLLYLAMWHQVAGTTIFRRHYSSSSSYWVALDTSSLRLVSFGSLDMDPRCLRRRGLRGSGRGYSLDHRDHQ